MDAFCIQLRNVQLTDKGKYHCIIKNKYGSVTSDPCGVYVRGEYHSYWSKINVLDLLPDWCVCVWGGGVLAS